MSFCTSTRLPAEQTSPWLMKVPKRAPSTAFSKSASLKKMLGDLPPSSSDTRLSWSAAFRMISFPISALPVNAILRTFGWLTSGPPAPGPSPGHDVHHAGRQSDGLEILGEFENA